MIDTGQTIWMNTGTPTNGIERITTTHPVGTTGNWARTHGSRQIFVHRLIDR